MTTKVQPRKVGSVARQIVLAFLVGFGGHCTAAETSIAGSLAAQFCAIREPSQPQPAASARHGCPERVCRPRDAAALTPASGSLAEASRICLRDADGNIAGMARQPSL